jgi:hypothetical protein
VNLAIKNYLIIKKLYSFIRIKLKMKDDYYAFEKEYNFEKNVF